MYADELRDYMHKRGFKIPFVCEQIGISRYKLDKYLDPNIPEPELWIRKGLIAVLDTIGLPEKDGEK